MSAAEGSYGTQAAVRIDLMVCPPIAFALIAVFFVPLMSFGADEPDQTTPPSSTTDVADLWRRIRNKEPKPDESDTQQSRKPFWFVSPAITSKPSTGLTVGVTGNLAFLSGDPVDTHFSTASANFKISVKNQATSTVRFGMFSSADKWFVQGENRFWWTSLDTYELGLDRPPTAENLRYTWVRIYESAYRRLPRSRVFIGGGVNVDVHTNVRPDSGAESGFGDSAYVRYTQEHGFPINGQTSSGTSAGVFVDTRDNAINAYRGWFASATYKTFFHGFLGGDSTWQEMSVDLRTYRALTPDARHRLAFWLLGDFVTGGTPPFLDFPSTSGDLYERSGRGYAAGQFRGPQLLYGEIEYRGTLTSNGLIGMVAFLNVTTVAGEDPGEELFQSFAPGVGVGLRVLLSKRTRSNLCVDYGIGIQGSRGFYLALQETF
jgi:outer membrane protein assembly factor BamA